MHLGILIQEKFLQIQAQGFCVFLQHSSATNKQWKRNLLCEKIICENKKYENIYIYFEYLFLAGLNPVADDFVLWCTKNQFFANIKKSRNNFAYKFYVKYVLYYEGNAM